MSDDGCLLDQIPSSTFSRRLRAWDGRDDAFPLSASIDFTERCNLRCRHCFIRERGAEAAEMDERAVRSALDLLRDMGTLFLLITGGEPILRPDFESLYRHAKQCGFVITLFSNGTLLDDRSVGMLAEAPPRGIEITIYGHTESVYESVTGVPGSYRRFRAGVDALLRAGLLVRLKSMVMKANAHELDAMRAWATGLGCEFRYDAVLHPRWNGDTVPLRERLDAGMVAALRRRDREQGFASGGPPAPDLTPPPPRQHLFECGAGIMTLHIDTQNRAHPCLSWRRDPFDLCGHPNVWAWNEHVRAIRNRPLPGNACDACVDRMRCTCCPALAVLETGNLVDTPSFFCQLARDGEALTGDR